MASFDYRLNPLYAIKECSSCGALYTRNCGCSKGSLEDKILVPVPDSSQRPLIFEKNCLNCGDPVHGLYCRQCALIRKTLEEVFQDFQDTSESSDDDTNFVNENQEPFVVNQDPGKNSSQSPPQINHNCCYECGDSLDGIFCQRCTCKSCGKGAHIGYNCPPRILIISNPEPCKNQTIGEPLQNLQSLQQQCLLGTCQKCGCNEYNGVCFYCKVGNGTPINVSTPYSSNDSPSVANHPPQPQYVPYSCWIRGNDSSLREPLSHPSESEGIPDKMCDVPLCENTTPLNTLNEHSEIVVNSNDDNSSSDDDSTYGEDIDYVDASLPDVEIVSLEVVEIVYPEVGRIDDDILLTIKDDILREKLLNVNLLIAKIDSLRDNPTPSSEVVDQRSSGSTTTHVDFSQYDSFIFDLSNDQFPPADRSDLNHEEFADELTHIMPLPELECFKFKIEPDPGDLTSIDPGIRKNVSTTNVNVPLEDDQSSLFAYVVWIFLAFLTYPVVPPYLLSTRNEDTIFDPGISI
ncbi:hypothetical protein Tco_0568036 [Tanacetum coccineum]